MDKKDKQLGMSYGKARNMLMRSVLLMVVTKAKLHICFKCGKVINRVDELTLEHKKPWLDNSSSLFWDLNNIAFSHTKCNTRHRKNNGAYKRRIVGPRGKTWCQRHKAFLPSTLFYKDKRKWNGLRDTCKACCKLTKEESKERKCLKKQSNQRS